MVRDHSRWFLRNLALDRNVVAAGNDCGVRAVRKEPGMTVCFTGDITARSSGWQYGLRQMAIGKQNCAKSSPSSKTTAATSPPPATAYSAVSLRRHGRFNRARAEIGALSGRGS